MGGDLSPPPYGETSAGGQSVNGGGRLMRGDIDLMGGVFQLLNKS